MRCEKPQSDLLPLKMEEGGHELMGAGSLCKLEKTRKLSVP